VASRQELREIPGIGQDLSAKITEYLATGTIKDYEDLESGLPSEITEWTKLPGLTEPIVRHLYFRLGMRSLDDVAALARSHMLRTLPGFSGSEEALLAAIREKLSRKPQTEHTGITPSLHISRDDRHELTRLSISAGWLVPPAQTPGHPVPLFRCHAVHCLPRRSLGRAGPGYPLTSPATGESRVATQS
jgi:DNA polymerase (family 10)